jgi:RNA polymerase sigma factor (sigma-70 family)
VAGNAIDKLTSAMAASDTDAVAAFYQEYFDWMFIQAKLATRRDESFCLDVVQDAVLRVIRSIKPVDSEPRLRAWLRLVVQTTAFDLLRREKRLKHRENEAAATEAVEPVENGEQVDWLADQLNLLDPQLVRMIELRFEHRWKLRRIGQLLGLTTSAVDGRLRRVLKELRKSAAVTTLFDLEDEAAMHDDRV